VRPRLDETVVYEVLCCTAAGYFPVVLGNRFTGRGTVLWTPVIRNLANNPFMSFVSNLISPPSRMALRMVWQLDDIIQRCLWCKLPGAWTVDCFPINHVLALLSIPAPFADNNHASLSCISGTAYVLVAEVVLLCYCPKP
jgi:hypothetical protein